MTAALKVNEIYTSLQGEGRRAGEPFVFVRLTGCALRCVWCDTAYAFTEGSDRSLEAVVEDVLARGVSSVLLTGGEPLEQHAVHALAERLLAAGRTVLVETGGHVDLSACPAGLRKVLDVKCPGSRMEHRNLWSNLCLLDERDEVKFVIADRADYDYARAVIDEHGLSGRVGALLFSPVHGRLEAADLSAWMLERPCEGMRLNLQLHKVIWPAAKRGV